MKLGLIALMLACSACGSSPNTAYYALAAVSGKLQQASLGTIVVRRPGIAGYLDRAEILAQWDGQRLQLADNACWGEPIAAMISRVLAEDLTARLPGTIVFGAASDLSLQASTVIELAITKFDLGRDGLVHLDGLASVRGEGAQPTTRMFALQTQPVGVDTGATVAAMSDLLGQLADALSSALLERGRTSPVTPVRPVEPSE